MPTSLARLFGRGRARKGADHAYGLRLAAALVESDQPLRVLGAACRLALRFPACEVALLGLHGDDAARPQYEWVAGGTRRLDRRLFAEALGGHHNPLPAVSSRPLWLRLGDQPFFHGANLLRRFALNWFLALPLLVHHEGRARRGMLVLGGGDPTVDGAHPLVRDSRLVWLSVREHLAQVARRHDSVGGAPWPVASAAWDEAPAALALVDHTDIVAVNQAARRLLAESVGRDGGGWQNWLLGAVRRLEAAGSSGEVLSASLSRNRLLAVAVGRPLGPHGPRLVALHPAGTPSAEAGDQEAIMRMLGHELRTPLTAMQTSLDLVLRGEAGPLAESQTRFLSTTRRNLDRLHRLLGDLLDARRAAAGRLVIQPETVDLGALLTDELSMLAVVCREKGLTLDTGGVPATFRACVDADKIQQMLHNVVGNAIKYTAGGGTVRVGLEDRLDAAPGIAPHLARRFQLPLDAFTLVVEDTGLGMSDEFLATIFQPFNREDRAETRRLPGAGLGLHITRGLVEAHGGLIRVESRPGEGTTMWLVLPREPASGRVLAAWRQLAALRERAGAAGLPYATVALDVRSRLAGRQPWEVDAAGAQVQSFLARLGRESRRDAVQRFAQGAGTPCWELAPGLWCGLVLDPDRLEAAWQVTVAAPESAGLLAAAAWLSLDDLFTRADRTAPPSPRTEQLQPDGVGV